MLKKRLITPIATLFLAAVFFFSATGIAGMFRGKQEVAVAETGTSSSSLFDGIIKLVSEKGAGIIKDYLPTVGDYLCATLFDYIGIDYSDSYTKEIKKVNEKLKEIQTDLQTILNNQTKQISQNTINELFNTVNTFSLVVHPIYAGYNELIRLESEKVYTAEQAAAAEVKFYSNNLKNLKFGSSASSGSLYLQLAMLLEKIVSPNQTSNKTIMEHYVVSYEHLWAFNTQSFAPKREFLGYLSTTALEGLMLYMFEYAYEYQEASDTNNLAAIAILESQWNAIESDADKAFEYLQEEINTLNAEIKTSEDTDTATHYATGTKVSKNLFTGKLIEQYNANRGNHYAAQSNYFTYESYTKNKNGWYTYTEYALNNRTFVEKVVEDYKKYIVNYEKGDTFTFAQFLQECGFSCNDWNSVKGIYMGQNYNHSGWTLSTEHWYFNLEYAATGLNNSTANAVDQKTLLTSFCYGQITQKVWQSHSPKLNSGCDDYFAAFVLPNGVLMGQYTQLFYGGSDLGSTVHHNICAYPKSYTTSAAANTLGKVR